MPTDRSAPGVRLTLFKDEKATTGEPLDLGGRLLSMTFEDCDDKADKLSLQVDNFDLALFDREELMGGAVLEVSWGYPGNMSPPRRVVIKSMKGFQQVTLEGQALSALMNQHAKTRRWEGKTRADVVREVAKDAGYEGVFVDIEDTAETIGVINQAAETDARFLTRLAAKEGFQFFVDGTGLHFHKRRQDTPPTHVFTWYSDPERGEVISVNTDSDLAKRAGNVTVKGRDPKAKTTHEVSSSADTAKRSTLADTIEVVNPTNGTTSILKRNATANVAPSSATTKNAAQREADSRFVKAERETVKLTMQVVGDPTIAAKTVIEVRGISPLLSGKYYVTEAKHSVSSSGYTVDLKLKRDGKGKPGQGGGAGAQRTKPQTGDHNASAPQVPGKRKEVERVNPETGDTYVEYRDDTGRSNDPEARPRSGGQ
jgi:phage protein D